MSGGHLVRPASSLFIHYQRNGGTAETMAVPMVTVSVPLNPIVDESPDTEQGTDKSVLPRNVAHVIKGTHNAALPTQTNVSVVNTALPSYSAASAEGLYGSYSYQQPYSNQDGIYVLEGDKFQRLGSSHPIYAYEGFLKVNSTSSTLDISWGASGVKTVHADSGKAAAWYTLDGRRLTGEPTVKGIYVHDGRKVVIR